MLESHKVGARGFEPPAFCYQSRRSARLSYAPMLMLVKVSQRALLFYHEPLSSHEAGARSEFPGRYPSLQSPWRSRVILIAPSPNPKGVDPEGSKGGPGGIEAPS